MIKIGKKISKEELINVIKYINNKYGFFATSLMKKEKNMPNRNLFSKKFGSLDNALIEAGIDIKKNKERLNKELKGVDKTYSNEYLINKLVEYNNKYGFPIAKNIKKNTNYPSDEVYRKRFGSFKNAILLAGIKIPKEREKYFNRIEVDVNKEINKLKQFVDEFVKENHTVPTYNQIKQENINIDIIIKKKTNFLDLFIQFGYEEYIKQNILRTKTTKKNLNEVLLKQLKDVIVQYGQINCKEFNRYGIAEYNTYKKKFNVNSYYELLMLIDIEPKIKNSFLTNEEIIKIYNNYKTLLGHIPSLEEITIYSKIFNLPDICSNIEYRWGYTEFLISIGDYKKSKAKIFFSNQGTKCFSKYELLFTNYFEDNKINYIKEKYYKDVIKNIDNKWRFDFYLPDFDLYIEIFGIIGHDKYNKKTKMKQNICVNNNIKLISVFPKDFIDNIYDVKRILQPYF